MSTDAASTEARNVRIIIRLPLGPLKHEALRTQSSLCVPWGRRLLGRLSLERTANCGPGGQESYHGRPRCRLSTPATCLSCLSPPLSRTTWTDGLVGGLCSAFDCEARGPLS